MGSYASIEEKNSYYKLYLVTVEMFTFVLKN